MLQKPRLKTRKMKDRASNSLTSTNVGPWWLSGGCSSWLLPFHHRVQWKAQSPGTVHLACAGVRVGALPSRHTSARVASLTHKGSWLRQGGGNCTLLPLYLIPHCRTPSTQRASDGVLLLHPHRSLSFPLGPRSLASDGCLQRGTVDTQGWLITKRLATEQLQPSLA